MMISRVAEHTGKRILSWGANDHWWLQTLVLYTTSNLARCRGEVHNLDQRCRTCSKGCF